MTTSFLILIFLCIAYNSVITVAQDSLKDQDGNHPQTTVKPNLNVSTGNITVEENKNETDISVSPTTSDSKEQTSEQQNATTGPPLGFVKTLSPSTNGSNSSTGEVTKAMETSEKPVTQPSTASVSTSSSGLITQISVTGTSTSAADTTATELAVTEAPERKGRNGLLIACILLLIAFLVIVVGVVLKKKGFSLKRCYTGSPLASRSGPGFSTFDDPIPFSRLQERDQATSIV